MQTEHKVLMIAYAFPPTGGSGVQRSAKFAKYLPQFGWRPTVWTVDRADGLPRDETLLYDLPPEVTVCANNGCGTTASLRRTLRGFANAKSGEGLAGVASRFAKACEWRLERWVESNCYPDDCIGWARRSLGTLRKQLAADPVDVLFSTYSPVSNHWLALELKRSTGLPWVADFRDLWTQDCRYRAMSPARRAADRRLEQEILESADAVVGVSPRQTEILAARVPFQTKKFVTITNGFDPDDFSHVPPVIRRGEDRFVLGYVGRFDLSQTSPSWFAALERFVRVLGSDRDRFVLRIAGHVNSTAQAKLQSTGVQCCFENYLPHREAISAMCASDALLLCSPIGPNGDTIIPAKLFEYLAAGRPIVTIGPTNSICERLVCSNKAGVAADFDANAIVRALAEVFTRWRSGTPLQGASEQDIQAFSRIRLTGHLAGVLEQLTPACSRPVRHLTTVLAGAEA